MPCPTCGLPLVPVPAVVVSGPPLPDVAECERGHQLEVLGAAAPDPVRPALGPDGRLIGWDWPIMPRPMPAAAVPWTHPGVEVLGDSDCAPVEVLGPDGWEPYRAAPTGQ